VSVANTFWLNSGRLIANGLRSRFPTHRHLSVQRFVQDFRRKRLTRYFTDARCPDIKLFDTKYLPHPVVRIQCLAELLGQSGEGVENPVPVVDERDLHGVGRGLLAGGRDALGEDLDGLLLVVAGQAIYDCGPLQLL
jgi:hypothetical protein